MENFLSAIFLTATTIISGQSIIYSSSQTIQNNSVYTNNTPSPDPLYTRVSIARPWLSSSDFISSPTPTPALSVAILPNPPLPPTPPLPPLTPTFSPIINPSPILTTPTPTSFIIPSEFDRLEKHRSF